MKWFVLVFAILFASLSPVFAQSAKGAIESEDPTEAEVGLYLVSLSDFDMAKQSYRAVFWAWFVHDDPEYKPIDSIEVINARSTVKEFAYRNLINGQIIDGARYTVEMQYAWDISFYPFDTQRFSLRFEDTDNTLEELTLSTDVQGSKLHPGLQLQGWQILDFFGHETVSTYPSSFGIPVAEGKTVTSRHANINFETTLRRQGWGVYIGSFATTILGFFLTLVMYAIGPKELEVRIGLVMAALFSVVGDRYSLTSILPPPTGPNLADGVAITTLIALLVAVVISARGHNAISAGRDVQELRRLNIRAAKLSVIFWGLANVSLVLLAKEIG
jgi:hypothetical protein